MKQGEATEERQHPRGDEKQEDEARPLKGKVERTGGEERGREKGGKSVRGENEAWKAMRR